MSAREVHIAAMIPELDEMRSEVAASAHEETDNISLRAYHFQAVSLRSIYGQIASMWFNLSQEVKRETGEMVEDVIELRYVEHLSQWLREHVTNTAAMMEGGELDLISQKSRFTDIQLAATREYAVRHHAMVSDYCERSASTLDERAMELRGGVMPRP